MFLGLGVSLIIFLGVILIGGAVLIYRKWPNDVILVKYGLGGNKIITSNGTFRIQSALKPLFDTSNKAALTNARATIVVKNGQITDVTSLILNKAGTSKKSVYFDGGDAQISGDLTVNADYVKIQDVSVDGQLIITNRVKKAVTLNEVAVDETITLKPIVKKR